jgi:tRNA (guanine-N7-)-methyltransferase
LNRPIRSFVLRQGRTTPAQSRALEQLLPKYGIAFSDQKISSGRNAPLVIEIGSGMGETTAEIAMQHPEADFVAIEVHGPGIGALLNKIHSLQLSNLRVVRHDAVGVLERMVADGSLTAVHLFFPDPWPKKRHHKRRLVQPAFLSLLKQKLKVGGIVHLATDVPDYADQMADVFSGDATFAAATGGFAQRPATKFEKRGRRLGNPVRDLVFVRK